MKITNVQITPLEIPPPPREHLFHSVNPIHRFNDLRYDAPPAKRKDSFNALVVQVDTDEGASGMSFGAYAVPGAYPIIEQILTPVVLGEDPLRTDWLWEKMFSVCIRQAGAGVTSSAQPGAPGLQSMPPGYPTLRTCMQAITVLSVLSFRDFSTCPRNPFAGTVSSGSTVCHRAQDSVCSAPG